MKRNNVLIAFLIISLAACSHEPPPKETVAPLPLVGTLKTRTLIIDDKEKVIVVDVPDYYMPRRCIIYSGPTGSNMDCTFDASDNATVINTLRNTD